MERTIKITNAIETPDSIEVSYDVLEGEAIIASGVKKFSLNSKKKDIEDHLEYILEKRAYETVVEEEPEAISPADTIMEITGLEVKPKSDVKVK